MPKRTSPESISKLSVALLYDDSLDSNDGVSQQVKRLGEYLGARGHKVVYLCGETSLEEWAGGKVYSLSKNIQVRFNRNRLSMPLWSHQSKIKKVLQIEKPDIIHVTTPYSPFMGQRVVAQAKRNHIAVVGSFHILPSGRLSSLGARALGIVQYLSLKKIQAFTSTSQNAAIFARQTMRIKSKVIPNAIVVDQFTIGRKVGNKPGRIVFLGRLVERKGCSQLIHAFKELLKTKPDAELIIAGDGPERAKLERLVRKLKLDDRVKFLGYIDEDEKPKILGSAQVACFPSLYGESFGVVLVEAMAAGAGVVVGGDNPGYQSVLKNQPMCLVDAKNTKEFSERLFQLLTDKNLHKKIYSWQKSAIKQYDIETVGPQIVDVYKAAIARSAKNSHNISHE